MGNAKQINVFDVLRGRGNEGAETYSARTIIVTEYPKELPQPNAGVYIPPSLRDESPPSRNHSSRGIPYAPKPKGWLERNWKWLLLAVVATVVIVLIIRYRRKVRRERAEEEYRQGQAERLPKIDYPKPSEAEGPVIHVSPPEPNGPSALEQLFDEIEQQAIADEMQAQTPPTETEAPNE